MPLPPTPKATWGASFANTWTFPGPVDHPEPKPNIPGGGPIVEADSGTRDMWLKREDHELLFIVRFIPIALLGGVTGWNDATTGVYQALLWMWEQNQFRFYPDATVNSFHTCYLLANPFAGDNRDTGGGRYKAPMYIRDVNGTAFTDAGY